MVQLVVDRLRVEAKEPGPQPVVIAVAQHTQVGRRGDGKPGPVRQATGAQGRAGAPARGARIAQEREAARRRQRLPVEPVQLRRQRVERIALRRPEAGPGREPADVARRHAERVGHQRRQVRGRLAVQDPDHRPGEEAVGPVGEPEGRTQEQQLAERARVERDRHLVGHGLRTAVRRTAAACGRDERGRMPGPRNHALAERDPGRRLRAPGQPQGGQAGPRLGRARRLQLGGGEQVRERVEIVTDADPALRRRLERRGATPGERVEHDVARPAVAGDERVGEGRREAREVRAHRMEAVAPQPWLRLPLGLDAEGGQRAGQLERELGAVRLS